MAVPLFTATAGAGFASQSGATRVVLAGATLILRSNVAAGELVSIDGSLERVEAVVVTLDGDGKINGDTGIQLLADDVSLGLARPLQWQADIRVARSQGFYRPANPFWFNAGTSGSTVNLTAVARVPAQL